MLDRPYLRDISRIANEPQTAEDTVTALQELHGDRAAGVVAVDTPS